MRRFVVLTLSVLASLVVVVAPTESASADWSRCWSYTNSTECHTILERLETSRTYGFRDGISNSKGYTIYGHCEATSSKTSSYSLGVSATTTVKAAIFGGFDATVSADISKAISSGYVTSANFKIPAHDTVYCDRGVRNERVRVVRKLSYCGGGCSTTRTYYVAKAPSRAMWWIY
jgi:hypothetical protein